MSTDWKSHNRHRTGKIARLPAAIQEQVNRRLQNNQPGGPLLAWLNRLPEVRRVLNAQFQGRPLNKQNLSQWRVGGFREWQIRQAALTLPPGAGQPAPPPDISAFLSSLTAAYHRAANARLADLNDTRAFKLLRACYSDVLDLYRQRIQAANLKLNQQRLAFREQARRPRQT